MVIIIILECECPFSTSFDDETEVIACPWHENQCKTSGKIACQALTTEGNQYLVSQCNFSILDKLIKKIAGLEYFNAVNSSQTTGFMYLT